MEVRKYAQSIPLRYLIWPILLLALILRLVNLDQSLWLDEAVQAIMSSQSIHQIIYNRTTDFQPPLFYLLSHIWLLIGSSEIILRILPVMFGVINIYFLYILAKKVFNQKVALLTTLLLSISPYHIYYSQEFRMYSLSALLATLSIYYLLKVLDDKQGTYIGKILPYIISTVLLIYNHYLGLFLIFTQGLYVVLLKPKKTKQLLIALLFVLIFYLPWIPILISQLSNGLNSNEYLPGWGNMLSLSFAKAIPLTIFKFSFGRIDFDDQNFYLIVAGIILILFGFLLLKGIIASIKQKEHLIPFWFLIPIFIALLVSFKVPLNQPFRLLFIIPAYYLLISLGIFSLGKLKYYGLGLVIALSLSGLALYYIYPKYQREDWRTATEFIRQKRNPSDLVAFVWPEPFPPYLWYSNEGQGLGLATKFPATYDEVNLKLKNSQNIRTIYLFNYLRELSDPNKVMELWMHNNQYILSQTYDFNGVGFVYEYNKK